jgi:PII-like signaling protein
MCINRASDQPGLRDESMRMQRISISFHESDRHSKPLHMELLKDCAKQGVANATVIRGVAGYSRDQGIATSSLVEAGGALPLILEFVDLPERVEQVLSLLEQMAKGRLITVTEADVRSGGTAERQA